MAKIDFIQLRCDSPTGATVVLRFQNQNFWGPNTVSTNVINLSIQKDFNNQGSIVLFDQDNDVEVPNDITHPPSGSIELNFPAPSGSYKLTCNVSS